MLDCGSTSAMTTLKFPTTTLYHTKKKKQVTANLSDEKIGQKYPLTNSTKNIRKLRFTHPKKRKNNFNQSHSHYVYLILPRGLIGKKNFYTPGWLVHYFFWHNNGDRRLHNTPPNK